MKRHQLLGDPSDSDRGPVTALVVHDDAQVLRMAVRLLREQGVDATGASSLVEANAIYRVASVALAGMGDIGTEPERSLNGFQLAITRLTQEREAAFTAEAQADSLTLTNG